MASIYSQLDAYRQHHPEVLESAVLWTAILARRRTPEVQRAMETWITQVLRYSRRDQLSVTYALASTDVAVTVVPIDNNESALHYWPVAPNRSEDMAVVSRVSAVETDAAHIARLYREIEAFRGQEQLLAARNAQLEDILASRSWRLLTRAQAVSRALRAPRRPVS